MIWNVTFQTFREPFLFGVMKQHFLYVSTCLAALQVRFQGLSGMIIMCNAVVIGLETDLESNIWFWVEWLGALRLVELQAMYFSLMLCLMHDMLTLTSDMTTGTHCWPISYSNWWCDCFVRVATSFVTRCPEFPLILRDH